MKYVLSVQGLVWHKVEWNPSTEPFLLERTNSMENSCTNPGYFYAIVHQSYGPKATQIRGFLNEDLLLT